MVCKECKREVITSSNIIVREKPITLADVFLALQNVVKKDRTYMITPFGEIMDTNFKRYATWNLKENLENQPIKTIEWLYNLIKE